MQKLTKNCQYCYVKTNLEKSHDKVRVAMVLGVHVIADPACKSGGVVELKLRLHNVLNV